MLPVANPVTDLLVGVIVRMDKVLDMGLHADGVLHDLREHRIGLLAEILQIPLLTTLIMGHLKCLVQREARELQQNSCQIVIPVSPKASVSGIATMAGMSVPDC